MPWRLESATDRHAEAPDTFEIPSGKVRNGLGRGDLAKLLFFLDDGRGNAGVERMWVTVVDVDGDGFIGRLENQPMTRGVIERGEHVRFGPDHVASAMMRPLRRLRAR